MAEFQEVCRQALRMAKENARDGLPVKYVGLYVTTDGEVPAEHNRVAVTPEKIERGIMEWAAAHPEPVYPSWNEAWKRLFPDSARSVMFTTDASPCPKYFLSPDRVKCMVPDCRDCTGLPIPADIAEKLGIKPISEEAV